MRIFFGILAGLAGLVLGWLALAFLVIGISGPGNSGGIAMSAFFELGPLGGLIGLLLAVGFFLKFSRRAPKAQQPNY
jgi:hypothetical protein